MLGELENLQKQKGTYESSIRESNTKLDAVVKSIADSKDSFGADSQLGKGDKLLDSSSKDKLFSSVADERNIQDLQNDIVESKKALNAKMAELQRLTHEIKVGSCNGQLEQGNKTAVDKELEDLRQNLEIYEEILSRLDFDNNELMERQRFLNCELQGLSNFLKIDVRIRPFVASDNQQDRKKPPFLEVANKKELLVTIPEQVQFSLSLVQQRRHATTEFLVRYCLQLCDLRD